MRINQQKINLIAKKYKLKLLILFGSQVEEKLHPESDLDLAFYAVQPVDEPKLYDELIDIFKRADIDLVNLYTTHHSALRYEILHTGKVLYEEVMGLKSKLEWQSYFDYVDFQKYYALRGEILNQRLAVMANG